MRLSVPLLVVVLLQNGSAAGTSADAVLTAPQVTPPELVAVIDSSNQAGWWNPIVEFADTTYYAYDAPGAEPATHQVHVASRSGSGDIQVGCLKESESCVEYHDDIGHYQPSIALDGDGYIHVFTAMHSNTWRYYRSNAPESVASFTNRASEMPDPTWTHTYPILNASPNGDLWLVTRTRSSRRAGGVGGRLYHYDLASKNWRRAATFAYQAGLWVNPDDIQTDPAGNVHIAFEWVKKRVRRFRNAGCYVRYDPRSGHFYNAAGQPIKAPLTFSSPTAYQPGGLRDSPRVPGVKTAKLTVDPMGQPHVVYRYGSIADARHDVRRARWVGGRWVRDTAYAGKYDTFHSVDVTHDGIKVRVYFVKKNTSGGDAAFVAEKTRQGGFVERSLAPGKTKIERLSVLMRIDGADVAYLSAPFAPGPDVGELYLATMPR